MEVDIAHLLSPQEALKMAANMDRQNVNPRLRIKAKTEVAGTTRAVPMDFVHIVFVLDKN